MTDPDLTIRSQQIRAAELERADRAEIARKTGVSRQKLARMLTCRSNVSGSQARAAATAAGFRVVERGLHAFTMEAAS
jgi:DNA-binding phage protein